MTKDRHNLRRCWGKIILRSFQMPYPRRFTRIGHVSRFGDIVKHSGSLKRLLTLHTGYDADIVDFITALTNRGFLDSCDSFILVNIAKLIQNPSVREQAISTVVMKLAEIGVNRKP